MSEFLVGLLNQAGPNNVQLVVEKCEADEHGVERARRLIANGVDGIILPPPLCDTPNLIDLIVVSGTPAVTVACGRNMW
jgi:LacI family transcriptional regulator